VVLVEVLIDVIFLVEEEYLLDSDDSPFKSIFNPGLTIFLFPVKLFFKLVQLFE